MSATKHPSIRLAHEQATPQKDPLESWLEKTTPPGIKVKRIPSGLVEELGRQIEAGEISADEAANKLFDSLFLKPVDGEQ